VDQANRRALFSMLGGGARSAGIARRNRLALVVILAALSWIPVVTLAAWLS